MTEENKKENTYNFTLRGRAKPGCFSIHLVNDGTNTAMPILTATALDTLDDQTEALLLAAAKRIASNILLRFDPNATISFDGEPDESELPAAPAAKTDLLRLK